MTRQSRAGLELEFPLVGIILLFVFIPVAPLTAETETVETPWVGVAGVQESTADIMRRTGVVAGRGEGKVLKPRLAAESRNFPQNPQSPASPGAISTRPLSPEAGNSNSPIKLSAQSIGITFTAATLSDASGFPPDAMGAAGPSQLLMVINGRVRTFDKLTGARDGILDSTTDAFFSSVMTPPVSNNFTSDPRVRYDRLSGRWFIVMIDVPGLSGSSPNRVLIAVSDSGAITANTVWTYFHFQQDLVAPAGDSNLFADYPTLGIDANALYIGVNIFGKRGNPTAFSNTTVFVVRKKSLLSGGPIVATAFRSLIKKVQGMNTGPYSPQGVDNYDPAAAEGYVLGVDSSILGKLQLRRISDPGGTPSISGNISVSTPAASNPINVPHLGNTGGTSGYLDGLDYRLLAAHVRNGRLWTTQNIGVNNSGSTTGTFTRDGIRWYELEGIATGQTPGVFQSGTLFQSSSSNTSEQRNYWMGTIMVSGQGHAAMGFSVAGANEFINAGTAGRLAGDPPGTMETPVLYTSSSTAYNPPGDAGGTSGRRWGDFSYTSLDPNDDMTMWTIQEYCDAVNSYGVAVAQLRPPAPALPVSCAPSTVAAGASQDVIITGSSMSGTGFFDPGLGFPNHLSVLVNGGGLTINTLTYTDPTHLTVNVSVAAGAVVGPRTVTVTNPDGQTATSASGILEVVNGSISNNPPTVASIPDQSANEQTLLTIPASATDPDGDSLTFSLVSAPPGMNLDPATGVLTWTPTEAQGPSTNWITVQVTDDGRPPLSAARTFMVVVNELNSIPELAPVPDQLVLPGSQLTLTNSATDADFPSNVLTFDLDPGAPAGAALDPVTGIFSWLVPSNLTSGTNSVTIRVFDNGVPQLNDAKTFRIIVVSPPVIESIVGSGATITLSWSALAGQTYRVQYKSLLNELNWTDLEGDVLASGSLATKTDNPISTSQRYYRVVLKP